MRKSCAVSLLLISVLAGSGAELRELPEVLAELDGVSIRRDDLAGTLGPRLGAVDPGAGAEAVRREVRSCVDDEIFRRLLGGMLREDGIVPSRELALEYIASVLRELPAPRRRELELELLPQADDPEFQLKAAVHFSLLRRFDGKLLRVTDAEVARYYRLNALRYRKPEHWDVGVIRIAGQKRGGAELAESVRARLLQGEAFEHVAREADPEGGGKSLTPEELRRLFADELTRLSPGDVSRVIADSGAYFVLKLNKKEPGGMIPIETVAGYIRLELSAAKDSFALRKELARRVSKSRIVYAPILPGR